MAGERFNVIVMILDDAYWEDFQRMHRLRTRVLPDGGNGKWVCFDRTYVSYSLCGPSRIGMFTGRAARHLGVYSHFKAFSDPTTIPAGIPVYPTDARSVAAGETRLRDTLLAARLHEVGYHTALFGKYTNKEPFMLGDTYIPPGWDRWDGILDDHEISDDPAGPRVGIAGGYNPPGAIDHSAHKGPSQKNYWRNDDGVLKFNGTENAGSPWTSIGTDQSGRWITTTPAGVLNTNYATDKFSHDLREHIALPCPEPFFIWWGHRAAHNEDDNGPICANRHNARTSSVFVDENGAQPAWPTGAAADPVGFNEANITDDGAGHVDKPSWFKSTYPNLMSDGDADPLRRPSQMRIQQLAAWRSLQAVDEAIYDLFQQLNAQPSTQGGTLADHTVLIVTNDNGFTRGQNRAYAKTTMYEPSIRTKMYVYWPTMPQPSAGGPGQHTDHGLVSLIDIAPTICAIAGVRPTRAFDGMDLGPRIINPATPWRRELLGEFVATTGDAADVPNHTWIVSYYPDTAGATLWKYVLIPPVGPAQQYNGPLIAPYRAADGNPWALGTASEDELYCLTLDPGEMVNLASNPAYATVRADMAARRSRLKSV
jgi:arylsulfatase A-like enzyme